MAFILRDRVRETTSTSGTGAIFVSGVVTGGYQTFNSVLSNGDTTLCLVRNNAGQWQTFLGTWNSATQSMARTTIYDGSDGAGVAVGFSGEQQEIWINYPAYWYENPVVETIEVNVRTAAGATVEYTAGISIVHDPSHAVAGTEEDVALMVTDTDTTPSAPTSPGWKTAAFSVGSKTGVWPLANTANILHVQRATLDALPAPTAANGVFFDPVNFVSNAWASPGARIAKDGALTLGPNRLTWSSAGLTVSNTGKVAALSSIASGGTGTYEVGETLTTGYGGDLWQVATVSAGAITGLTMLVAPTITSGSAPSNPVALTGGANGSGATVNLTWTDAGWTSIPLLSFLQSGSGAVTRSAQAKARDIISLKDFGAIGDGVTDDTAAVTARNVAGMRTYVPDGTYLTTIAHTAIAGVFFGPGQIITSDTNRRGPYVSQVTSAPSTTNALTSVQTAFNGDYTKAQFLVEHRITGAATLGQPASGYRYVPEAYPFVGYLYNTSGWNQSTSVNDGRTGAAFFRIKVDNYGQGDAAAYNASVFVSGARSGATSFLANPAGSIVNGDISAGQAGVYLNPFEVALSDGGYDVSGVGWVVNTTRTVATAALGVIWAAYLSQSKGAEAIDAHFAGSGKATIGVDFAASTFGTDKVAVAMQANDRIYLASTNVHVTKWSRYTTPGDTWITYNSTNTGVEIAHASAAAARFSNPASAVNLLELNGAATGNSPGIAAEGSDTNIDIILTAKGSGAVALGSGGPKLATGAGVPAATMPVGSLYLRTGGGVGSTLYVSQGGGTWNAVAGV